jgi:flagellar biosynthesis protein FlhB
MSQERTEKPTPKKLLDARKRGQVARSRDLALAAASVAATMALASLGAHLITGLIEYLRSNLARFGDRPLHAITAGEVSALIATAAMQIGILVGPVALATSIAAVGMHGFQGGWSFAPGALRLHWNRLSPASGLSRFSFSNSGVETLKVMLTATAIVYFAWTAIDGFLAEAPQLAWLQPVEAGRVTWKHAESLLWRVAWTLAALAMADYGLQRYRWMAGLKMTRQEIRDEARQNEGSTEVKGRIRRLQRELARRRMLSDVAKATVVITNPTHYAVALEYKRESMAAPRVLAKGRDHLAQRIKERALKHGIPLVENKPLAQSLFATAEIGEVIPAELFAAVAEVLAYLIRIKRLML